MENSEKKMLEASQIAYLSCIEVGEKNLILEGKKSPFNVKDLILSTISLRDIKELMEADGIDFDNATFKEIIQYSDLSDWDKGLIQELSNEALSWKIVDIHDTTAKNGFYGCVIETSEENAIVGIRGSEGLNDYAGAVNDWVKSDFGLLNSEGTIQTEEVDRYAIQLAENHILDKYEKIDACGHSLGGNLASHFAVACASNMKTENIYDKLGQISNFDGPGVSDEYLDLHSTAINKVSDKITHYKWSPVGSLLYSLPGENEEFLKTRKYYGNGNIKDKIGYYTFGKHDTRSLIFDGDGMAERGKEGILAKSLGDFSHEMEQIPNTTNAIASLAASTIGKMIYQKEDGSIGFKLPFTGRASDDYRNAPTTYQNMKIKCGDLVNGMVDRVKDYTTGILDKLPDRQNDSRLAYER